MSVSSAPSPYSMSRVYPLEQLRLKAPSVLPSMLLCDFANLRREIETVAAAGVCGLHLDVMDGHFVPNLTYGLTIVETCRAVTDLPLDVHLMIANPADYVKRYVAAGADVVTIHAEAVDDPRPVLQAIREAGAGAGLAINPPTPVSAIEECLDICDLVLVMSVMPGFGGQAFDPRALEKLRDLKQKVSEDVLLEVDGGVNHETIEECSRAGADLLVAGSAIFCESDSQASIRVLNELARSAHKV